MSRLETKLTYYPIFNNFLIQNMYVYVCVRVCVYMFNRLQIFIEIHIFMKYKQWFVSSSK